MDEPTTQTGRAKYELRLAVNDVMHIDIMFMSDGYVIVVDHEPHVHVRNVVELKAGVAKVLDIAFSDIQESEVKKSASEAQPQTMRR